VEEALKRHTGRPTKNTCSNGTHILDEGPSRQFMAPDAAASEHSVQRVFYIKAVFLEATKNENSPA